MSIVSIPEGLIAPAQSRVPWIRHVGEGEGRTFRYQLLSAKDVVSDRTVKESVRYIATSGCISCVGVYFPIGDVNHFLAHIFVFRCMDKVRVSYHCSKEEGQIFCNEVLRKLELCAHVHGWNLNRKAAREGLGLCCQRAIDSAECESDEHCDSAKHYYSGVYVVQAIRKFLLLPETTDLVAGMRRFDPEHRFFISLEGLVDEEGARGQDGPSVEGEPSAVEESSMKVKPSEEGDVSEEELEAEAVDPDNRAEGFFVDLSDQKVWMLPYDRPRTDNGVLTIDQRLPPELRAQQVKRIELGLPRGETVGNWRFEMCMHEEMCEQSIAGQEIVRKVSR